MTIYDCFTYFNEEDVLMMRLEELYPVVDHFVLVESDRTFRGKKKPYFFKENQHKFDKYLDKIVSVRIISNADKDAWKNETQQRNMIVMGLVNAQDDDTIIISDVDEIPRRSTVKPVDEEHRLIMDKFTYGLNMKTTEGNSVVRMLPYGHFNGRTIQEIRTGDLGKIVYDAGWEFSSLGTEEEILTKLKSFSHSEFDTPDLTLEVIRNRMRLKQDIVGREMYHTVVPIDNTWPEAVKNDYDYWRKYIWLD